MKITFISFEETSLESKSPPIIEKQIAVFNCLNGIKSKVCEKIFDELTVDAIAFIHILKKERHVTNSCVRVVCDKNARLIHDVQFSGNKLYKQPPISINKYMYRNRM